MERPFALPPGITPGQARDASLAICSHAADRDEATWLLRCAGLIPDPSHKPSIAGATERKARQREAAT